MRNYNTTILGFPFSADLKFAVWIKADIITGVNSDLRRVDKYGAIIDWNQYGVLTQNGTGWEIDHIKPVAREGSDRLDNLQPLQWQNNRMKSDSWPPRIDSPIRKA